MLSTSFKPSAGGASSKLVKCVPRWYVTLPTFAAPDAKSGKAGAAAKSGGRPPLLPALGAKKVGNIFVHLRKVAQHPLLVRSAYTDATVQEIAAIAHKRCVSAPVIPLCISSSRW